MNCRNPWCSRPATHWRWFDPARTLGAHLTVPTCSPFCAELVLERHEIMVDPLDCEMQAMDYAANCAGEFIESIGNTDMAAWSVQEWRTFIRTVCGGYVENLLAQQADVSAAVSKVQAPAGV